jgi:hypothetical protein
MSTQLITDNRIVFQSPKTIDMDTTSSKFAILHISIDNNLVIAFCRGVNMADILYAFSYIDNGDFLNFGKTRSLMEPKLTEASIKPF